MMHVQRSLTPVIHQVSSTFPVLLLTGPRQVGKSTLLVDCATPDRSVVTLDDMDLRALAKQEPMLFLQIYKPPLIIDEIQYAPELLNCIKIMVDELKQPGLFWLTGSQKFHLMQGVSETLAGRIAILDLLGFSERERGGDALSTSPFLPTSTWIKDASVYAHPAELMELYQRIWRGSFPSMVLHDEMSRDIFYQSYLQTYIQRDVRALTQVGDEIVFSRFLRATAARTGQLINYADIARDVGVDMKTIKSWISILETSGLIYLLYPYHSNVTNRLIKTPKLYFLDTGLCAYLTHWSTPAALEAGALSGAILETYLFSEILKSYWHHGKAAYFYFYRDRDQREIDLLIEEDGILYPIEFKKSANPSRHLGNSFSVLDKLKQPIGPGAIICLKATHVPLSHEVMAIPVSYL